MVTPDLDESDRLAREATPGPWVLEEWNEISAPNHPGLTYEDDGEKCYDESYAPNIIITDSGVYPPRDRDAVFIAYHHPARILRLNAELRLLRELERIRWDRANHSEEEREVLEKLDALRGKEKP